MKKITYEKSILDFNIKLVDTLKQNNKNVQFIYFSGIGIDKNTDSKRSKAISFPRPISSKRKTGYSIGPSRCLQRYGYD